jgi:hypothetical protein
LTPQTLFPDRYLEAILHGCWVLHVDYLANCATAGYWLPEEGFEIRDLVPLKPFEPEHYTLNPEAYDPKTMIPKP